MCDSIEFFMKKYLHMPICSFCGLLLVQFLNHWTPVWCPGCPQKRSKFFICPKWLSVRSLVRNYFSVQIRSFWGLLLEKWAICDPFWPLWCPKKGQNLWFVLNVWQSKICDQKLYLCAQKLYLCANFKLLCVIFRGMGNFLPFCPHWPLGCPKTSQNKWLDKNKYHNRIPHAILWIHVKY